MRLSLLALPLPSCGFTFLLALLSTHSFAQPSYRYQADTSRNRVIAVSGLNLRDAPGANGKILAKIPFGEHVKILGDTIFAASNPEPFESRSYNYWVKAEHTGQTGYLYDAYLYRPPVPYDAYTEGDVPSGLNQKYRLFTNRGSANLNYNHFSYKWYGLYASPNSCTLSSITPSYRYYPNDIDESLEMTVNNGRLPVFFIASKKGLNTGSNSGQVNIWNGTSDDMQAASEKMCTEYNISAIPGNVNDWAASHEFTLTQNGKSQLLNPGGRAGSALYVEAATDLDGDGKTDFIISYNAKGYDYTLIFALFLSSEARAGELVRPVAMQYVYSGC